MSSPNESSTLVYCVVNKMGHPFGFVVEEGKLVKSHVVHSTHDNKAEAIRACIKYNRSWGISRMDKVYTALPASIPPKEIV